MTAEPDPVGRADEAMVGDPPLAYLVGRLVSLRYVMTALGRRRRVWLGLAALGLVLGVGFHFAVPRQYQASATLYLAHLPGTDDTIDMANDLALLQTKVVGQQAVDHLHEPNLSATKLLGKAPGVANSDNVMTIHASGPTKSEAVARVNAVARAFLAFRAAQGSQQAAASTSALQKRITALNTQINTLSGQINGLDPATQGAQLTSLVVDRSADVSEVTNLEQTVQQAEINASTVASGSRILTPGTANPSSTVKLLALDGLSGLVGGLALGVGLVALGALLSDRVRRRDEVSALIGASVELSLCRPRRRRGSRRSRIGRGAARAGGNEKRLTDYFSSHRTALKGRSVLLVVAADEQHEPAAALAALAARLADEGSSVVVADLTTAHVLVDATHRKGRRAIKSAERRDRAEADGARRRGEISIYVPEPDANGVEPAGNGEDVLLVLASIDPGIGAWHLGWATTAIVTVTAGRSSAQHVSATAELLRAAGVSIAGAVLLDADDDDETVGLVDPDPPVFGRRPSIVPASSNR